MKRIIKYIVLFVVITVGLCLIYSGMEYKNYQASQMKIRGDIELGEYVLAEQKLAEMRSLFLYRHVFERIKTEEYHKTYFDEGLIQLGFRDYTKAEKAFSIAFEASNTKISSPAGINKIASLWSTGKRNQKITKTVIDIAKKIIKYNHDSTTSREKRQAQRIAFYLMARQQSMVPKEGEGDGQEPGKTKRNKKVEKFMNIMKNKDKEMGR